MVAYLIAVPVILFAWQLVGGVPILLLIIWVTLDGNPATAFHQDGTFSGVSLNLSFTTLMLASWAFVAGIFLAVRFIHQRRFLSLVTPSRSLDWRRLFQDLRSGSGWWRFLPCWRPFSTPAATF